jgi:hypothetical protein
MDSRDLSEAQLDALFAKLAPMSCYPNKVQDRMFVKGWSQDDELFTLVRAAHEVLHELAIRTRDLACDQVMRKPEGGTEGGRNKKGARSSPW